MDNNLEADLKAARRKLFSGPAINKQVEELATLSVLLADNPNDHEEIREAFDKLVVDIPTE